MATEKTKRAKCCFFTCLCLNKHEFCLLDQYNIKPKIAVMYINFKFLCVMHLLFTITLYICIMINLQVSVLSFAGYVCMYIWKQQILFFRAEAQPLGGVVQPSHIAQSEGQLNVYFKLKRKINSLHSTDFTLLNKMKVNSIPDCGSFKGHNFCLGWGGSNVITCPRCQAGQLHYCFRDCCVPVSLRYSFLFQQYNIVRILSTDI